MIEFVTVLASAAAVVVAFAALLAGNQGDWSTCWYDVLGPWRVLVGSRVAELSFYRSLSGFDEPVYNMMRACAELVGVMLILVAVRWQGRGVRSERSWRVAVAALGAVLLMAFTPLVLKNFFVGGLVLCALFVWALFRFRRDEFDRYHHLLCWSILGVGLLAKVALNPRVDGYGFALSVPVMTLGTALAVQWFPVLYFRGRNRTFVRALIAALLVIDVLTLFSISQVRMASKNFMVQANNEEMHSYPCIGPIAQQAIDYVQQRVPPDEPILVLPEGITINYLARRPTPTRYVNFMPPELTMYGERRIVAALNNHPPETVLLVRRVVFEYGFDRFGDGGYGELLLDWVKKNYLLQKTFGEDPLGAGGFGISILRRRVERPMPGQAWPSTIGVQNVALPRWATALHPASDAAACLSSHD